MGLLKRNRFYYILMIIFGLIIYLFNRNSKPIKEILMHNINEMNYSGIIKRKFIDKENHSSITIELESLKKLTLFSQEFYDKVEVGDSIVKKKNSFYIYLFRNDTLLRKLDLKKSRILNE